VLGPIGTSRVLKNFESRMVSMRLARSTSPTVNDSASDIRRAAPYIRRKRQRNRGEPISLRRRRHDSIEFNKRLNSARE
jgi:hypothetical protein